MTEAEAQEAFQAFQPEKLTFAYRYYINEKQYNFWVMAQSIVVNGVEYKHLRCEIDNGYVQIRADKVSSLKAWDTLSDAARKKIKFAYEQWVKACKADEALLTRLRKEAYQYRVEQQENAIENLENKLQEEKALLRKFQDENCFPYNW